MKDGLTPIRQQYLRIKKQYPEAIVLFRLGDFYETFDEDAKIASKELEIVLTSREMGKGNKVPLAGIPYHALDGYLAKLINRGYKVAIVEQMTKPGETKGLVQRDVVRLVTPGTVLEPGLLDSKSNNYLVSVVGGEGEVGLAFVDITTSEFATTQLPLARAATELQRLNPSEVIAAEEAGLEGLGYSGPVTRLDGYIFGLETATRNLLEHFGVASLEGYGCAHLPLAIKAAGAIVHYIQKTQKAVGAQLTHLSTYTASDFMALDAQTQRNLELFQSARPGTAAGSLLSVIDLTKTPMGGRLLKRWLGQPLLDVKALAQRQDAIGWFAENALARNKVITMLGQVADLERLINRVKGEIAGPRELIALRRSLEIVPKLKEVLEGCATASPRDSSVAQLSQNDRLERDSHVAPNSSGLLRMTEGGTDSSVAPLPQNDRLERDSHVAPNSSGLLRMTEGGTDSSVAQLSQNDRLERDSHVAPNSSGLLRMTEGIGLKPCREVVELIARAIVDEPSNAVGEGGVIRQGFSEELDTLRQTSGNARKYLAGLEVKERERTGIKSLKIGFNNVFGYYIEVSNSNLKQVPQEYIRKQTLVNGERFFTPELKEYESLILNARDRIADMEAGLFRQVCRQVAGDSEKILALADTVAKVDVFAALGEAAVRYGYSRPVLDEGKVIDIKQGRHPVVERNIEAGGFVPNDIYLSNDDAQLIVLTGPNMSGKSTYLRQVALIVLLAQVGGFVPAQSARIGIVDRIFTRIGARDDLAAGQSTFMVEMVETANILNNATPRSLLILDEIGRGTSTYDGLSIARAVAEYIHNYSGLGARTVFATHYHEMVALAGYLPRVKNFNVAVIEEGGKVIFLHKIVPGGVDKSYGIHVAQLAGLPRSVLHRAREVLDELESNGREAKPAKRPKEPALQAPLFGGKTEVEVELQRLDLDGLTPLEALNKLYELKKKAGGEK
ncbi:MAG: DNA mismatch repair protein MutS [Dehalococcoidales bacterium]